MKNNKKVSIVILVLILLSILGTAIVYPQLPAKIPSHWDINGQVNAWSGRSFAFFTACLPLIMFIMLAFLPVIDPKKEAYEKHKKAYDVMIAGISVFLIIIHWVTLSVALGAKVSVDVVVLVLISILFIILGNYMTQIRQNYFFGLKTPWTLANEEVWKKSNRVAGYGLMLTGVLTIVSLAFVPIVRFIILIGFSIGTSVYSMIYSYVEFKKIEAKK